MVVLQSHRVVKIKRTDLQTNLETGDGLTLAMQTADFDSHDDLRGEDIQVAWGNYHDSHPIFLAIFYREKRIFPKDITYS